MKTLLQQLIQARSTLDTGEQAAAEVVAAHFAKHGIESRVDRWGDNRANVIAHVKSSGRKPALLFVCHLDVVGPGEDAWTHPAFQGAEADGRIYGRGAVDMKGGIAATVAAICNLVDSGADLQGDIIFTATAGEETDSAGVERFMQNPGTLPPLGGIVIPEPTDFSVITAHRGLLWLHITTRGRAVHSSMPERGVNAILSMKQLLDKLERYEVPGQPHPRLGKCSISINTITGGEAMNIVPDRCTIGVDIRTLPGQNHEALRHDIERMVAQIKTESPQFSADIAVDRTVEAMETDAECDFVKTFCSAVNVDMTNAVGFTTDAPHLVPLGVPIVIYGPGNGGLCHQVDEYIEIAALDEGAAHFEAVMRRFLT